MYSFLIGALLFSALPSIFLQGTPLPSSDYWQSKTDSIIQAFNAEPTNAKVTIAKLLRVAKQANKHSLPAAVQVYDAAIHFADSLQLMDNTLNFITQKAVAYQARTNFSQALRTYYQGIKKIDKDKSGIAKNRYGWFHIELGNLFYQMHFYREAEKNYHEALKIFLQRSDTSGPDVAYNNIGLCKSNLNSVDSALHYFKKGLQHRKLYGSPYLIGHSYLYFAKTFYHHRQLDSSHRYLKKAQTILEQSEQVENKYQRDIYLLYANVLFIQGKNQSAIQNLRRALRFEPTEIPRVPQETIYNRLAENYLAVNKLDSTKKYAFQVIHSTDSNNLAQRQRAFKILQELYIQKGIVDSAYYFANKRLQLSEIQQSKQEQILTDFYKTQIQLLENSTKNENLLLKSTLQEEKLRLQRNVSLIALVTLLLLGMALYIIYRQRRKVIMQQYHYRRLYKSIQLASERSNNILLMIDEKGYIEFINDKARNLFEIYDNTTLQIGDSIVGELKKNAAQRYWKQILNRAQTLQSWQAEQTFNAQGKKVHTLLFFMPLEYNGVYNGMVMVGIDTTEQKNQNDRLTAQAKDLEIANRSKEKIISVLAHDLKEGIYSSHALGEIVLDNAGEQTRESLLEYTELINQNLVKTKYLLEEVMDWVRNQGDDMQPQPVVFDINDTLQSLHEHFYKQVEHKGINLTISTPAHLKVIADSNMIRSVLYNLLSNAIKFSPAQKGEVKVYHRLHDAKITLYIEDNGAGLTADETLQIKRKQGVSTRPGTEGEKGTGVGLQLVMDLLALNQSKLHVESAPQQGTTFYFSLPAG